MSKSIEVTIKRGGKVTIEAHGFKGSECVKATEFIEEKLKEVERERKAEFGLEPDHLNRQYQ